MPRHFTEEIRRPGRRHGTRSSAFNDASAFHRGNLRELLKKGGVVVSPSMMPRHFTEEIHAAPSAEGAGFEPAFNDASAFHRGNLSGAIPPIDSLPNLQ